MTRVEIQTQIGCIVADLDLARAPVTAANFLRYVDLDLYREGCFYRTVRASSDPNRWPISIVQAGLFGDSPLAPINHESTAVTGLKHLAGTLTMARSKIGSANSEFVICVADSPELDAGGHRHPDLQGFAAFGRIIRGMDIVEKIHRSPTATGDEGPFGDNELLDPPIDILGVKRIAAK